MEEIPFKDMGHREFLSYAYALVNPMQLDAEQWRDLPAVPLHPRSFAAPVNSLPHVVALNALNEAERLDVLTRSGQWQNASGSPLFSALLRSEQTQAALVEHFSERMVVATPQRQRFWLRFHDPRVFERLTWLLNSVQMRRLLGPVDAWTCFDAICGQWRTWRKPGPVETPMLTPLDPAQWAALYRLPLLNRCLKRLRREGRVPRDYRALAERLDASLHEAFSLGLMDRDDACLYALEVERHGPQWSRQEHIRDAIRLAQSGEQSLVRGLAGTAITGTHDAAPGVDHSSRYA